MNKGLSTRTSFILLSHPNLVVYKRALHFKSLKERLKTTNRHLPTNIIFVSSLINLPVYLQARQPRPGTCLAPPPRTAASTLSPCEARPVEASTSTTNTTLSRAIMVRAVTVGRWVEILQLSV